MTPVPAAPARNTSTAAGANSLIYKYLVTVQVAGQFEFYFIYLTMIV
jgi:hypothetical protein